MGGGGGGFKYVYEYNCACRTENTTYLTDQRSHNNTIKGTFLNIFLDDILPYTFITYY